MEVNPRGNIPIVKIANMIRVFNTLVDIRYYFKFLKYKDHLMGILSKVIILGGIFVLLFGVFSIILE
ncbi:MAG: hypothetical protein O3C04_03400 [Crenarchaeota archaeon]|nr:hypothetical protein [Thermoproteota archaeon]MDA1124675.1 hypothetical protein [Thermoproteota archaeon]